MSQRTRIYQESYKERKMGRYNRTFIIVPLFFFSVFASTIEWREQDSTEGERGRERVSLFESFFSEVVLKVSSALVIFNNPP